MSTSRRALVVGDGRATDLARALNLVAADTSFTPLDLRALGRRPTAGRVDDAVGVSGDVDFVVTTGAGRHVHALADDRIGTTFAGRPVLRTVPLSFAGLHPDALRIRSLPALDDHGVAGFHSRIALYGFLRGLEPDETVRLYRHETYAALDHFAHWRRSLRRLEASDLATDLPYVEDCVPLLSQGLAMYTPEHPAPPLVLRWAQRLLDGLLRKDLVAARAWEPDPWLLAPGTADGPAFPVYPEIAEHHGLGLPGSYVFKGGGDRGAILHDLGAFVAHEYEAFTAIGRDRLASSREWTTAAPRFENVGEASAVSRPRSGVRPGAVLPIRGRRWPEAAGVDLEITLAHMHLDPADNRAQVVARRGGVTQPRALTAWIGLVRAIAPELVLDVGANYGEMSLPLIPTSATRIHAFEPNPRLAGLLRRSVATHALAPAFTVVEAAVSDAPGTLALHVDRKWSGTSSLDYAREDAEFKGDGPQSHGVVDVRVVTLDDHVATCDPALSADGVVALKIDVEGHEPRVFAGAAHLLRTRPFAALFEFSADQLAMAGSSADALLEQVTEYGRLYSVAHDGSLRPRDRAPQPDEGLTDLVVSNIDGIERRRPGG